MYVVHASVVHSDDISVTVALDSLVVDESLVSHVVLESLVLLVSL